MVECNLKTFGNAFLGTRFATCRQALCLVSFLICGLRHKSHVYQAGSHVQSGDSTVSLKAEEALVQELHIS